MAPIRLTDEQIRQFIIAFRKQDVDKDGFITRNELYALLEDTDLMILPDSLVDALKHLNMEKDAIDKTEVLQLCKFLVGKKQTASPQTFAGSMRFAGADTLRAGNFMKSVQHLTTKAANWIAPEPTDMVDQPVQQSIFSNTLTRNQLTSTANMQRQPSMMIKKSAPIQAEVVVEVASSQESLQESDYEYYSYSEDESSKNDSHEDLVFKDGSKAAPQVSPVTVADPIRYHPNQAQSSTPPDDVIRKAVTIGDKHQSMPVQSPTDNKRLSVPAEQQRRKSVQPGEQQRKKSMVPTQESSEMRERAPSSQNHRSRSPSDLEKGSLHSDMERDRLIKAAREMRRREKDRQMADVKNRGRSRAQREVKPSAGAPPSRNRTKQQVQALMDPKIRKQLANIRIHKPYFLQLMTVIQILVMAYEIYFNSGFAALTQNPFGGPSQLSLIQIGGLYTPCMRVDPKITRDFYTACVPGYPQTSQKAANGSCLYFDNLNFQCGLGGFSDRTKPDQAFRFLTPIFLHTGVLHLIFNLIIQTRTGFHMESQLGSVRMALIYFISGVGGNLLAAMMNTSSVTVGASGALYGLFALLYLDLLQNWPLLVSPVRDLAVLSATVMIALCVGLLPFIDNFAHIGGFVSGLFSGLLLMPKISFSTFDRRRKIAITIASLPILIILLAVGFNTFYKNPSMKCDWCIWLDCVPPSATWCQSNN